MFDESGYVEFVTKFDEETNCGTYEEIEYPYGAVGRTLRCLKFKKIKGDDGADAIAVFGIEVTDVCEKYYNSAVEIPDEIMNLPVTAIEPYASNVTGYNVSISDVKIPGTITSIGEGAFADMGEMESVKILKTVKNIGEYAFGYIRYTRAGNEDVFEKCEDFVIFCSSGSAAEEYAKKNGFICKPLAE